MHEKWNPDTAAERLLAVSDHLIRGERFFYEDGPMSEAPIIYEDWYRE